jgi:3-oxoacyl-[acyl-carrier protein] reductase
VSRVALVTGGAGGLGGACVEALTARGLRVAVADRDVAAAGGVLAVEMDVTSSASVAEGCARVAAELGDVTVLVNGAGIVSANRFEDIGEEEFDAVMDVSVKGSFLLTRACLDGMRRAGYGRIVNFSSTAGKNASTLGGAHYTTAKAALLGLTRATAAELGPLGITVNAVCPGLIDAGMAHRLASRETLESYAATLPSRRLGQPWEVGALVAFLCSDDAAYITGAALDINGGELMV